MFPRLVGLELLASSDPPSSCCHLRSRFPSFCTCVSSFRCFHLKILYPSFGYFHLQTSHFPSSISTFILLILLPVYPPSNFASSFRQFPADPCLCNPLISLGSVLFQHPDLHIVKINFFDETVPGEATPCMILKVLHIDFQPKRLGKIELITGFL